MKDPSPCFVCGSGAVVGYDPAWLTVGIKRKFIRCSDPHCDLNKIPLQFTPKRWKRLCQEAKEHHCKQAAD